jgi:hypothetical protein
MRKHIRDRRIKYESELRRIAGVPHSHFEMMNVLGIFEMVTFSLSHIAVRFLSCRQTATQVLRTRLLAKDLKMAEIEVTLDVTGFYFSEKVKGDDTVLKTVKDVMLAVVAQTAGTDKEFTFKSLFTAKGEFCSKIQVHHRKPPSSRQFIEKPGVTEPVPFPPNLAPGVYGFDDENPTFTNPQLAWQYYVVGDEGKGALRSGEVGGRRTVVPFSDSNRDAASGGVTLVTKDVIVWRLVAICNGPTVKSIPSSGGVLETFMKSVGMEASAQPIAETPLKYRALLENR